MKAKRIFSIIVAVALTISVSAQQSVHDNYFGVSFGGGLNSMLYQPVNGQQQLGFGFDAGLFYGRFFNQTVGLSLGLNYTWANAYALYNWNEVTNGLTHASNPNVPYNLTTGFNNWKERQNVGVLSIPVELLLRKQLNDRAAFIAGLGVSVDFPIHGTYSPKAGDYSTTGVFPSLGNYTISNMPEHGFNTYTDIPNPKMGNLAKVGASALCDLGFRMALNDNWGLYLGVYAAYGFTNLLKEAKTDPMVLINDQNTITYRGTFECNETAKANLLRAGIKLVIDFGWPAVNKKQAEAERIAREAFVADSIAAVAAAEQARLAAEQAAREKEKAEAARIAREKAEAERIAAEKAEAERIAAEKAFRQRVEDVAIHFEKEGAKLNMPEAEKAVVDELCEKMKADKSIKIVITGHTDNYGDARQNLEFYGVRRAEALKAYMVKQGVDASQIKCDSKGQTEPVAPNNTRENRAKNRRAVIHFQ